MDEPVPERLREAVLASRNGLHSGEGSGSIKIIDAQGKVREAMVFEVHFSRGKLNLDIRYTQPDPNAPPADRRIVISDGSAIFANALSDRYRPVGGEVRVEGLSNFRSAAVGFPINPAELPNRMISTQRLLPGNSQLDRLPNGRYRVLFDITPMYGVVVEFAPEYGFNAVVREGRNKGGAPPGMRRMEAQWAHESGVWFITKFTEEVRRGEDFALDGRVEFVYDEFRPNVDVPEELFTLSALQMLPGSRLIDGRTDATTRLYEVPGKTDTAQAKLDSMIEQAKSFPAMRVQPTVEPGSRWTTLRFTLAGVSVVCIAATILLLWRMRRRSGDVIPDGDQPIQQEAAEAET